MKIKWLTPYSSTDKNSSIMVKPREGATGQIFLAAAVAEVGWGVIIGATQEASGESKP